MSATDVPAADPVPARQAATLLLVADDPFRVLMVERSGQGAFPSARVFPGGTLDADDAGDHWCDHVDGHAALDKAARSLRIAAWRETWEEAGIAPVGGHPPLPADVRPPLLSHLRATSARIDLAGIVPFGRWTTPTTVPRRYDTHFFIAAAACAHPPECDGSEIVGGDWFEPHELIARAEGGDRSILFSTLANLHLLVQADCAAAALAAARTSPVSPVMPQREEADGEVWVWIPEESGYPFRRMRFAHVIVAS